MKRLLCFGSLLTAHLLAGGPSFAADAPAVPASRVRLAQVVARAPAAVAEAFTFSGKVVDADGKAVAGATVELHQGEANSLQPLINPPTQTVTTGADGAFSVTAVQGSSVLLAWKAGMAPAWRTIWRTEESLSDLKLVLSKPTTISGKLVDDQGKAVPGAAIQISAAFLEVQLDDSVRTSSYLLGKRAQDLFSATTGASGEFSFTNVTPRMRADFAVQKPGYALRLPEQLDRESLQARAGQTNVQLVVIRAGSIAGRVVSDADTGISHAKVRAAALRPGERWGGPPEAETAADGSFALDGIAPGDYQLAVNFETNGLPEWVAETLTVPVEAGKTAVQKITATRGGTLEVTVVDSENRSPVARAQVSLNAERFQVARTTGKDGTVMLRVPAGEVKVFASKDMSRTTGEEVTIAAGEAKKLELTLKSPPRLSGQVTDATGKGIEGVQLRIIPDWMGDLNVTTDAEGKYSANWDRSRFGSMNDRQFYLVARHPGRNLAGAEEIVEDAKTINIQLKPALVITGRVENVKGKGISEASINLYFWAGNMGSQLDRKPVKTDADGNFSVGGLPAGSKYSVNASAKGYGSGSASLEAEETGTDRIELPVFTLEVADLKLSGKVVDSDDKPVAQAYVHIYGQGQPQTSARTEEDGTFSFDAVCAGEVNLSASVPSGSGGYGSTRAQGGDTNVVIQIGASSSYASEDQPKRVALKGKPLPDLATAGLGTEKLPAEKPVLLCLFDAEQRPSRRVVRQLTDQLEMLKAKNVVLVVLQVNPGGMESYKEWKTSAGTELATGCIEDKADAKLKWAMDMGTLPWLILTDKDHKVSAEGFGIEDLESKLQEL